MNLIQEFKESIERRFEYCRQEEGSIPTYFDHFMLHCLKQLSASCDLDDESSVFMRDFIRMTRCSRFINYLDRVSAQQNSSFTLAGLPWTMSQGVRRTLRWSDRPLCKSVFDLGMYSMLLNEIKPRTIIELGSGLGASAKWFKDQTIALGFDCKVVSIDKKVVPNSAFDVTYINGDVKNFEAIVKEYFGGRVIERPVLVIDDAHACLNEVLIFLWKFLDDGDYFVVEDNSDVKTQILKAVFRQYPEICKLLLVDQDFTDFFGINSTSARDAIFRFSREVDQSGCEA